MLLAKDAQSFYDEAFMVMTRVQRKIINRSGASLSVALLFFLVCAIVGSILIAAASVAMGRMKNIDQGEQDRYACDSAMELIAEKMQGGEISFEAEMPLSADDKGLYVQYDDQYQTAAFDNSSNWDLSQLYSIDSTGKKVLATVGISTFMSGDFQNLRNNLAGGIFQKEISNSKVLGDWYMSAKPDTDEKKEKLAYGSPDTKWADIAKDDYMFVTDDGTEAKPLTISLGTTNTKTKVNILFCMDAQFNITAVIYPYVKPEEGENEAIVNDPKNAALYRIIMIPAKETSIDFDPGITQEEQEEEKTITNADGTTSTITIIHTLTYVQHDMKVKIAWGNAVKTSVLPSKTSDPDHDNAKYPDFFPDRFKDVLSIT